MADDFFKNISKTFRETMGTVGKKTDEFVEIQKIRNRQGQLETRIENNYQEIGRKVYARYSNGEAFDEQTAALCQEIMRMEKEIALCKEQAAEKKGLVICPSCSASVPKEASYCMHCGTQLPVKQEEKPEDASFTEVPEDAFEPEETGAEQGEVKEEQSEENKEPESGEEKEQE